MCGRFVQRYTWDDIQDLYELPDGPARNLQAHYNVAPTDPVNVVRTTGEAARELVSMRWGLIPWWWKKPLKQMPASFNARAESVADKPMFRDAFRRNRCVIPASGYYEWLKRPDGRQPDYISAADGGVLSFAGLWDRWKNPETGEPVISCTIIVTDANALTRPIHDRMPVVLDRADIGRWLRGEAGTELLRPASEDHLRMWPVSRRVNKTGTGDDDPTLLDEVAAWSCAGAETPATASQWRWCGGRGLRGKVQVPARFQRWPRFRVPDRLGTGLKRRLERAVVPGVGSLREVLAVAHAGPRPSLLIAAS